MTRRIIVITFGVLLLVCIIVLKPIQLCVAMFSKPANGDLSTSIAYDEELSHCGPIGFRLCENDVARLIKMRKSYAGFYVTAIPVLWKERNRKTLDALFGPPDETSSDNSKSTYNLRITKETTHKLCLRYTNDICREVTLE